MDEGSLAIWLLAGTLLWL